MPNGDNLSGADMAWQEQLARAVNSLREQSERLEKSQEDLGKAMEKAARESGPEAVARVERSLARVQKSHQSYEAEGGANPELRQDYLTRLYQLQDELRRAKAQARTEAKAAAEPVMMEAVPEKTDPSKLAGKLSAARQQGASENRTLTQTMEQQREVGEKLARAQLQVGIAYGLASAGILRWVKAGLSGTTTGEYLSFSFNQLQRSVVSIFLPAIEAGIAKLQQITNWFRSLSGEQQANIARWAGVSMGILGTLTLLPKLINGFSFMSSTLSGMAMANPLLMLTGGVVALLSRTEEGRASLSAMASGFSSAFGAVADILSAAVLPWLELLSDLLNSVGGKFVVLGGLAALALTRIVMAVYGARAAFMSLGGAIGIALGLIGLLATAFSGSGGPLTKSFDEIAARVRTGKTTIEDARKEVEDLASAKAFEEAEEWKSKPSPRGTVRVFNEKQRREELEAEGKGKVERGAAGAGRRDLVTSRSDPEAIANVLKRIETGSLKADLAPQRTADAAEGIWRWLKDSGMVPQNKNNQDKPANDA